MKRNTIVFMLLFIALTGFSQQYKTVYNPLLRNGFQYIGMTDEEKTEINSNISTVVEQISSVTTLNIETPALFTGSNIDLQEFNDTLFFSNGIYTGYYADDIRYIDTLTGGYAVRNLFEYNSTLNVIDYDGTQAIMKKYNNGSFINTDTLFSYSSTGTLPNYYDAAENGIVFKTDVLGIYNFETAEIDTLLSSLTTATTYYDIEMFENDRVYISLTEKLTADNSQLHKYLMRCNAGALDTLLTDTDYSLLFGSGITFANTADKILYQLSSTVSNLGVLPYYFDGGGFQCADNYVMFKDDSVYYTSSFSTIQRHPVTKTLSGSPVTDAAILSNASYFNMSGSVYRATSPQFVDVTSNLTALNKQIDDTTPAGYSGVFMTGDSMWATVENGLIKSIDSTLAIDPSFVMEVSMSAEETFTLPLVADSSYNFEVDWGDGSTGTVTAYDDASISHTYASTGNYQIAITGTCEHLLFANGINADNVSKIIQWGDVGFTSMFRAFSGCHNLSKIPDGPITGATNVTNFNYCFSSNNLTSLPAGLFDNTPNVTEFQNCFAYCSLTSLPAGLFDNTPNVIAFDQCFHDNSLTSIPAGLFDNTPNATEFFECFKYNELTSIPLDLFNNILNVHTFYRCFASNYSLGGNAPTLWLSFPEANGSNCFEYCTGLDNYADIPTYWK